MLNATGINNDQFLEYKGKPLVRQGDDIYYGDLSADFHIYMMVMDDKEGAKGVMVPTKIMVQLRAKGSLMPKKQHISEKGFADALEIAAAWLDRANSSN